MNLSKVFLILFLSVFSFADSVTKDIGSNYQFTLTYNTDGTHQTGQTIPLSIKRISDGYWYDFTSSSFKASGWTSKTVNLTEDTTNHNYYYTWVAQGGDTTKNQYIFHVECSGAFITEETIIFEDLSTSIAAIKTRVNAINP